MASNVPSAELDTSYSSPDATPTDWSRAESVLTDAAIYWLSTVRVDGRPHVTPVIAVWHDGAVHFCTGPDEQKAQNLAMNSEVVVTTGKNEWSGLDVVVEGAPACHRRRRAARPRGRVGGQVRRGLALRRLRRGLSPRGRCRPRLRGRVEQGLRLRPRRARWRHPLPVLTAQSTFCPYGSRHNDRFLRTERSYRDRDGGVGARHGR